MKKTLEEKRAYGREYMRRWRAERGPVVLTPEQREAARERSRQWQKCNPRKRDPAHAKSHWLSHPWARSLGSRQAHAKKRGIPFTLKVVDVKAIWTGRCAITDLPFDLRAGQGAGPRAFSPSLDRIKPELGYVPGNIRFVLQCVSAFRGQMKDRLMARVAAKVVASGTLGVA